MVRDSSFLKEFLFHDKIYECCVIVYDQYATVYKFKKWKKHYQKLAKILFKGRRMLPNKYILSIF